MQDADETVSVRPVANRVCLRRRIAGAGSDIQGRTALVLHRTENWVSCRIDPVAALRILSEGIVRALSLRGTGQAGWL